MDRPRDFDALLTLAFDIVSRLPGRYGGYPPFAIVLDHRGEPEPRVVDPARVPIDDEAAVRTALLSHLAERYSTIRACAVLTDLLVSGCPGMRAELEEQHGYALEVTARWIRDCTAPKVTGAEFGVPLVWPPRTW